MCRYPFACLLTMLVLLPGLPPLPGDWLAGYDGAALAQDDDDDDNDGGDDGGRDDDDGPTGGNGDDDDGSPPRGATNTGPVAPSANLPRAGGDRTRRAEISGLGLSQRELSDLLAVGFVVVESRPMALLAEGVAARLRVPDRIAPRAALDLARQTVPGAVFDLSHLYEPNSGGDDYAPELIGFRLGAPCGHGVTIGMIDGAVADHPLLQGSRIIRKSFSENAGSARHGTAVASILVGRGPSGVALLDRSRLYAAAVFSSEGGGSVADAIDLVAALDWLTQNRIRVINISIAGPPNDLLAEAVRQTAARGAIIVAAAGNGGSGGKPRYPAAYPEAVAVSAVDARGRAYRGGTRGPQIDIAAPGVDIWAADAASGKASLWSGTSFAAPYVTIELALAQKAGSARSGADARAHLARNARDLGSAGVDAVFGAGLLQSRICANKS